MPTTSARHVMTDENTLSVAACVWQLDKGQDGVRTGILRGGPREGSAWMIVYDGHGRLRTVPRWLDLLPQPYLEQVLSGDRPTEVIEERLAAEHPDGCRGSGACVVVCRVSPTGEIECWWAGDSRIKVLGALPDGTVTCLLQTDDHVAANTSELERLMKERNYSWKSGELEAAAVRHGLLTPDPLFFKTLPQLPGSSRPRATMCPGMRVNFSAQETELQMTRSLGHAPNFITGRNVSYKKTQIPAGVEVWVIAASDGIWDVEPDLPTLAAWAAGGAENLVVRCAQRWADDWDFQHHWAHDCLPCVHRRERFCRSQLDQETDMVRSAALHSQLAHCLTKLASLYRSQLKLAKAAMLEAEAEEQITAAKTADSTDEFMDHPDILPVDDDTEHVISTQPGIKPDDICCGLIHIPMLSP